MESVVVAGTTESEVFNNKRQAEVIANVEFAGEEIAKKLKAGGQHDVAECSKNAKLGIDFPAVIISPLGTVVILDEDHMDFSAIPFDQMTQVDKDQLVAQKLQRQENQVFLETLPEEKCSEIDGAATGDRGVE